MSTKNILPDTDFIKRYLQNAPQVMWLLGAGTSRSAGLPTASDIIFDLKRNYYCLHENQILQSHDINNNAVKHKIQAYMDSKGFPALWSPEEYSFYFNLNFGKDYGAQQKYIQEALAKDKISLNIGHRVLAALLDMGLARVVFTTNFDDVIETAYAFVSGKNLSAFHLEGSYAALSALNEEKFPLYAKIHGDFRYKSIKNLEADLLNNDVEIQKCFLAAGTRYGLIVSGYSGRDANVMKMLRAALDQNNAFPHGLYWTVPRISSVSQNVIDVISYANKKGVSAFLVETGTFDEILSKIWRQIGDKSKEIDGKVRTSKVKKVFIPLPSPGGRYPILRTNALPLFSIPSQCGLVNADKAITYRDLIDKKNQNESEVIVTYTDRILYWGEEQEINKIFPREGGNTTAVYEFGDAVQRISESTFIKSFFEEAIATALCRDKPLLLRRSKNRTYYAVVREDSTTDASFSQLRQVLGFNGNPGVIAGYVKGIKDVSWAEAVSIKLEEREGKLWVMLKPDIWVKPLSRRFEAVDFLRERKRYRYNNKSNDLLDAWIGILMGSIGEGASVKVSCFPDAKFAAIFEIGTRTAFSRGYAHGG